MQIKYFPPLETYLGALPRPDIQIAGLGFHCLPLCAAAPSAGSKACHLLPPTPPSFCPESTSPAYQTPGLHLLLFSRLPANITLSCLTVLEDRTPCALSMFPILRLSPPRARSFQPSHLLGHALLVQSTEWHLVWVSTVFQNHGTNTLHLGAKRMLPPALHPQQWGPGR